MSFETLVDAPVGSYFNYGYETVSTSYLEGLKNAANLSGRRYRERNEAQGKAAKAEEALAAAKEEIGELKDLLKQVLRQAQVRASEPALPRPGQEYVRHYVLGQRPDLRIEIEKSPGLFGQPNRRRVLVYAAAPPDPDAAIVTALRKEYPGMAESVLGAVRRAGLDITLKDQGKITANADATSLKLVS